jgi:hypothetical protein
MHENSFTCRFNNEGLTMDDEESDQSNTLSELALSQKFLCITLRVCQYQTRLYSFGWLDDR